MASFGEHSISSKIDSSNAEISGNADKNYCINLLPNSENNNIDVNVKHLTIVDKVLASSAMENVMVDENCARKTIDIIHSNDAFTAIASAASTAAATAQSNGSVSVPENVVSSTQRPANESIKTIVNTSIKMADGCGQVDCGTKTFSQSELNEKCLIGGVASSMATSMQSKLNKSSMDDSKLHLHATDVAHNKSKSSDKGLYSGFY